MSYLRLSLALCVAVGLMSGFALAQDTPKPEAKPEAKGEEEKMPPKKEGQEGERKKGGGGALGLPGAGALKEKCGLSDDQAKKVEEIYASYKDKVKEAGDKMKGAEGEDRKKAGEDLRALREEIAGKVCEVGAGDEQKGKLKEACASRRRKKDESK